MGKLKNTAVLLIHCADQPGIVAKISEFLFSNEANILDLDQHVDHEEKEFYMRVEWDLENFHIPKAKIGDYFNTLIASHYNMHWNLYFSDQIPRMAIFVSKMPHCLFDILARYRSNEWNVEIPLVIANHEFLRPVAEGFNIPFHCIPINSNTKIEAEAHEMALLQEYKVNLIVLARYMQILSSDFIQSYPNQIINIHHSFLPAFPGAKPYHSAYKRGVKIIGATSHYVTSDLDEGPIIDQDVTRISHEDSIDDLVKKGQDLEKIVLSRAIDAHLQHRLLVFNNRVIVFR